MIALFISLAFLFLVFAYVLLTGDQKVAPDSQGRLWDIGRPKDGMTIDQSEEISISVKGKTAEALSGRNAQIKVDFIFNEEGYRQSDALLLPDVMDDTPIPEDCANRDFFRKLGQLDTLEEKERAEILRKMSAYGFVLRENIQELNGKLNEALRSDDFDTVPVPATQKPAPAKPSPQPDPKPDMPGTPEVETGSLDDFYDNPELGTDSMFQNRDFDNNDEF